MVDRIKSWAAVEQEEAEERLGETDSGVPTGKSYSEPIIDERDMLILTYSNGIARVKGKGVKTLISHLKEIADKFHVDLEMHDPDTGFSWGIKADMRGNNGD